MYCRPLDVRLDLSNAPVDTNRTYLLVAYASTSTARILREEINHPLQPIAIYLELVQL